MDPSAAESAEGAGRGASTPALGWHQAHCEGLADQGRGGASGERQGSQVPESALLTAPLQDLAHRD